jgi:hypothetical protein
MDLATTVRSDRPSWADWNSHLGWKGTKYVCFVPVCHYRLVNFGDGWFEKRSWQRNFLTD